jgi:hypothetical protein
MTRQDKGRQDYTRQGNDKTRQDNGNQDNTRQQHDTAMTRQHTRQDKTTGDKITPRQTRRQGNDTTTHDETRQLQDYKKTMQTLAQICRFWFSA